MRPRFRTELPRIFFKERCFSVCPAAGKSCGAGEVFPGPPSAPEICLYEFSFDPCRCPLYVFPFDVFSDKKLLECSASVKECQHNVLERNVVIRGDGPLKLCQNGIDRCQVFRRVKKSFEERAIVVLKDSHAEHHGFSHAGFIKILEKFPETSRAGFRCSFVPETGGRKVKPCRRLRIGRVPVFCVGDRIGKRVKRDIREFECKENVNKAEEKGRKIRQSGE